MNSWRLSSVMWPVRVRKSMAANHSSSVSCHLAGEGVQVANERLQDLAQARIGRAVEAGLDGPGQLGVGEVAPLGLAWLVARSLLDLRAGRPACQVPLHALARVGVQPAAERTLELARQRQQRALVAARADELDADGQAGSLSMTGTATAGNPSALA